MMTRLAMFTALSVLTATLGAQAPDRTRPPQAGPPPAVQLPTIQKRQLSNGLPVWLVEAHEVPVAQVNLVVLRGSADDPAGKFGVATLTASMLLEGAGTRSSLELADAVDFLGADLTATAGIDSSAVRLHVPVARLADALPLMADVALRPTFPTERARSAAAGASDRHPPGARQPGHHQRDGVQPRAVRRLSPVRHAGNRHRGDDPVVHHGRPARLLRLGVSTVERGAARRRRRDHGEGAAAARIELRRMESARAGSAHRPRSLPLRRSPSGPSMSSTSPERRSRRSASAGSAPPGRRRTTFRSR